MHTVSQSRPIATPALAVWQVLRDFDGLSRWHPSVTASRLDGPQQPGCVRTLSLAGGGVIRERLESLDDYARQTTYALVEGPLPVGDYLGTLSVHEAPGGCVVKWSATMTIAVPDAATVIQALTQVYADGLAGLEALVSARPA